MPLKQHHACLIDLRDVGELGLENRKHREVEPLRAQIRENL
jgi:hypothetical protein